MAVDERIVPPRKPRVPNGSRVSARAWYAGAAEAGRQWALAAICRVLVRRVLRVRMEGLAHLPREGPVILACRHYHYLYDGCALLAALPRRPSILLALDWVRGAWVRRVLAAACAAAGFPVVLRDQTGAIGMAERRVFLTRAARLVTRLLREGKVVVIFPEGYPTIDPIRTVKADQRQILPFRPGLLNLAAMAQQDGASVAIMPVGLHYTESRPRELAIRLGAPLYLTPGTGRRDLLRQLEERVHDLSRSALSGVGGGGPI